MRIVVTFGDITVEIAGGSHLGEKWIETEAELRYRNTDDETRSVYAETPNQLRAFIACAEPDKDSGTRRRVEAAIDKADWLFRQWRDSIEEKRGYR